MDNSEVMTVARVFEPTDEGVEAVFLESAMFYRLERENPDFDRLLAILSNSAAEGRPVEVGLRSITSNIIESVRPV